LGGGISPQPVQQPVQQPARQGTPVRQQPPPQTAQRRQPEVPKGRPDPLSSKIQRIDRNEEG
jgi:hypothetical protein